MSTINLHSGQQIECLPVPRQAVEIAWRKIAALSPALNIDTPEGAAAAVDLDHRLLGVELALAFPAVEVPAGWEFPEALGMAGIKPREGRLGRLADYVEFSLLSHPADWERALAVIRFETRETEAGIDAAAETFRPEN